MSILDQAVITCLVKTLLRLLDHDDPIIRCEARAVATRTLQKLTPGNVEYCDESQGSEEQPVPFT